MTFDVCVDLCDMRDRLITRPPSSKTLSLPFSTMPPNYESESFWNTRFKSESHFEWLGNGQETIIPGVHHYLEEHRSRRLPPRTLHIGAGTSTLSQNILRAYHEVYSDHEGLDGVVVNTDFAEEAVVRGRQTGEAVKGEARWERVDLLSWNDCKGLVESFQPEEDEGEERLFEIVVDKSTSDAISCGGDVSFRKETLTKDGQKLSTHPLILKIVSQVDGDVPLVLEPLEILALHLASLVKPGGVWIALSYSSHRFPFLATTESHVKEGKEGMSNLLAVSRFWETEKVEQVDAPSGGNAHAPVIQHHLYTLRRTNVPVK